MHPAKDRLTHVTQDPAPGTSLLMFRGDTVTFSFTLAAPRDGNAFLRTNIGHAKTTRGEILAEVDRNENPLGRDWYDIPMTRLDGRRFRVTLPLSEIGHFEAKCLFFEEGEQKPLWPEGPNVTLNVEPADTVASNTIYNVFVRQFGPNKAGGGELEAAGREWAAELEKKGYAVIPPSGTFRDVIRELDFIIHELGFRVLQLLPIHPTPTTYGRMGRFGSPYAALSFTAVDPALARFDPKATPLEQFIELVDAIHERQAKIFLDIAINHTGWAAGLHESHPRWIKREPNGDIEVPGAWGVRWEDLTSLDYRHQDLWQYMADIFLTWCHRGVDGFRCDAGYMIPFEAWKYIIAAVREEYPRAIFFLEGLGGRVSVTRDLLNRANFNWAYSELFQNYDRGQIEAYLPGALEISAREGLLVQYSETHDNNRLAARSQTFARLRTALCALFSQQGAHGFANGVEWFAKEKINVHGAPSLNWGAKENQVAHVRRLNRILAVHPCFHDQTGLALVQRDGGNVAIMLRRHHKSGKNLLVFANLDDRLPGTCHWDVRDTGIKTARYLDLVTERTIQVDIAGDRCSLKLDPGQVLCLTPDPEDIGLLADGASPRVFRQTARLLNQELKAKAQDVFRFYHGIQDLDAAGFDSENAARALFTNPIAFCRSMNPAGEDPRVIEWRWPRDLKREVMIPPGHFLLVRSEHPFRASILAGETDTATGRRQALRVEDSLEDKAGRYFALFYPLKTPEMHTPLALKLSTYTPGASEHKEAPLLLLAHGESMQMKKDFGRRELLEKPLLYLGTNGRGAMTRAHGAFGELGSRYDALLAGNLHPGFPEDRHIMFSRLRGWIEYQGFSQAINLNTLDGFSFDHHGGASWYFHIPSGQGEHILLEAHLSMVRDRNAIQMVFRRRPAQNGDRLLPDQRPVRLILRPDIEDRNFHHTTKAYAGPEQTFPAAVEALNDGFSFAPDKGRMLRLQVSRGRFTPEPEWHYMTYRPVEAQRGLDPHSDLFSPGYFEAFLTGAPSDAPQTGETVTLTARIDTPGARTFRLLAPETETGPGKERSTRSSSGAPFFPDTADALHAALDQFVVKRDAFKTVIAGYPWFLDWGRDTLIFVRGLIAAGRVADARMILKQFGQFEKDGTLPNMIRGSDAGNRDTSDAPLWFFIAARDLVRKEGSDGFLDEKAGDRTIRQILLSIGRAYMAGTPNGIRMDPQSGLIFSPAHFTWMDTNHPAGSPREGYPIEIQAFWHFALSWLAEVDRENEAADWQRLADKVRASIRSFFWRAEDGFLADCLHTPPGGTARRAQADDALRPNQLFAVTLGALEDVEIRRRIVQSCQELLVPGAIRSLADRPVHRRLEILHQGRLLNDPLYPYQGRYEGDEDTRRKPAYHNGTAWTWMFPVFCEAWAEAFGRSGRETAGAWLSSCSRGFDQGCVGQIPEILDGDHPHTPRGCDAQAWGVSELLRVWIKIFTT